MKRLYRPTRSAVLCTKQGFGRQSRQLVEKSDQVPYFLELFTRYVVLEMVNGEEIPTR